MADTPQRLALVTGASGGIGSAIVRALASRGHALALVDLALPTGPGAFDHARSYACDLRDPTAIEVLVDDIRAAQGAPSILVNNAGIFPTVPLAELSLEIWREVFAINLDAPMLLARHLAADMRTAGWGRIVNIASSVTQFVRRDVAPYVSSKMGLIGLTRALASDLGPYGITVNAISPGLVATPNVRAKFDREGGAAIFDEIARRQAIPSSVTPEDIAEAVCAIIADEMGKITGQTLLVDGGLSRL